MYLLCSVLCCFFFKQKTAYEMRISDWSSDVCSSDLPAAGQPRRAVPRHRSTTQTDDDDVFRLRMEQQERHHLSRVAEVQFERIANGHLALNRIEVKMQSPGHAIVHHKGLSIRPVAQGLQDLRYVGTRQIGRAHV